MVAHMWELVSQPLHCMLHALPEVRCLLLQEPKWMAQVRGMLRGLKVHMVSRELLLWGEVDLVHLRAPWAYGMLQVLTQV